ncbi:MAG: type II toxin-antitoxin system VapC family toxin [Desulfosarcina sp.]|nr:type II toxin-antitoxin system VapC family toxin [Desulfosarcina sp.]MBC2764543.1 type II toxin-antitoxin system VapC family toxin [Desulfosarcina sp.]
MIALDTNAIIRVLTEDNEAQAKKVQDIINDTEANGRRILIISEVVIETVWVLESVYQCTRQEISMLIENLLATPTFFLPDSTVIRKAFKQFKNGGDFADLLIVGQAKAYKAKKLFSFDKKLQNRFPNFVTDSILTDC